MVIQTASPLQYQLQFVHDRLDLNACIGKTMHWNFTGKIACISCGRRITKSYQQGHCYPCTQRLASCDICIVKPELCHFAAGTCREPAWGLAHCMQDHVVYLSYTSTLKVGISRKINIPYRWYDQGAIQGLVCFVVSSRLQSGLLEQAIARDIADKTNWRKMLQPVTTDLDLAMARDELLVQLNQHELLQHPAWQGQQLQVSTAEKIVPISYPVLSYPPKVTSINVAKTPSFKATLLGMKAQYCIFDIGVINIRKYSGYELEVSV